jgi:N-acetylmuramoyl-L-alanine amidase
MKAVMIRNGDYFVKLRERVRIAQAAQADLFVSIHADAFDDTSAHGASVYTLANKGASSQMAQFLAKSENASDASGADAEVHNEALNSILQDLSRNASKEASQHIGNKVLKSVKSVGHLHTPHVQKAGFVVLKSPIPSILVEAAFISNPEEERRLNTRAYQDQMATAVFGGILAHFKQYAPANTLFAQLQKSGRSATKVAALEKSVQPVENKEVVAKLEKPTVSNSRDTKHVISNGETLSDIAQQYGVSMREIRMVNGMNDGNVKIGQVLQIPRSS